MIIATEHKPNICRLSPDADKVSRVDPQALFTFKDQQQFKVDLIFLDQN